MKKEIMNKIIQKKNLDVIISLAYQTRLWYAKILSSSGYIFIEKDQANLIVDGRYIEYANNNAKNVEVYLLSKSNFFKKFAKSKHYKRIGVESDYITLKQLNFLKKIWPKAKFIEINGKKLRMIKSNEEILNIKKACKISLAALKKIKPLLKPGISENLIDHQLNFEMKKLGADKESFDSVVVSGSRGALPHGKPSNKKLKAGELVTIDLGVYYKGYASDITRTFKIGKISNSKLNEIYNIVKKAQANGIKAIAPGINSSKIDEICRRYIEKKGYGKYFIHSTGHGLGIDVHELPHVSSSKTSDILEPGMVITVEPGIYIEEFGGVRFEDDILITNDGYEILSR